MLMVQPEANCGGTKARKKRVRGDAVRANRAQDSQQELGVLSCSVLVSGFQKWMV